MRAQFDRFAQQADRVVDVKRRGIEARLVEKQLRLVCIESVVQRVAVDLLTEINGSVRKSALSHSTLQRASSNLCKPVAQGAQVLPHDERCVSRLMCGGVGEQSELAKCFAYRAP